MPGLQLNRKYLRATLICGLRVEFLLKTDNGYPKDTGVTFFPYFL